VRGLIFLNGLIELQGISNSKLLKDPVILGRLDKQGIEPRDMSNADFGKLLAADYVRMAQVVKASGAKID
jgi:tripartite-type tricarboxylate transporter receptor subunit TctC